MHVSHLDAAEALATLDGSTIREPAGTRCLRVGDQHRDVAGGERVVIAPSAVHELANAGDEPRTPLCCCAPADSNDDTVLTGG